MRNQSPAMNISETISKFLDTIKLARSENTARSYRNAMNAFTLSLEEQGLAIEKSSISLLKEDYIAQFATDLKSYTPATEQLYLTAAVSFYKYLVAENIAPINLPRVQMLVSLRGRRPGKRLPQFPRDSIEKVIEFASSLALRPTDDEKERLRNLRDRAFILTLADTGLRVHEACNLRRGTIDMLEGKAILIGKGNQEAIVPLFW